MLGLVGVLSERRWPKWQGLSWRGSLRRLHRVSKPGNLCTSPLHTRFSVTLVRYRGTLQVTASPGAVSSLNVDVNANNCLLFSYSRNCAFKYISFVFLDLSVVCLGVGYLPWPCWSRGDLLSASIPDLVRSLRSTKDRVPFLLFQVITSFPFRNVLGKLSLVRRKT